jgi:histidinol-phosphate aminotransferase
MPFFREAIEQMEGYRPGEQPQDGSFIKLNTNENPYPPSAAVITAIEQSARQELVRYPDPLATAFRMRAADLLGVDPDWILCGNGSDDLLTIATRALVGSGEMLRFPYPSYVLYRTLAELQGARCQELPFQPDWSLPAAFGQAEDDLRLVFLPNPNSPTGTVIDRQSILALAESLPCPLLVDEAYVDFAQSNCLDLVARNEKIMVTRTLSKSYALAGLRFGFLVAQPQLIEHLVKVKDSYNCDALSIAAATAAIGDQKWLEENRARVLATRERMSDRLEKAGFNVAPSQANFVWCTHQEEPLQPVYEHLKSNHVLVRYIHYPDWGEGLRISVGTDPQVDACLDLLEARVRS